jgi:hypothetical protein
MQFMATRQKLNGALLTEEEKATPIGIGYVMAARRLGLKYLDAAEVMLGLLVEFGNEAWHFSLHAGLPPKPFWKAMNKKADSLAAILKGRDPGYMATSWFTDPHQLRAHLLGELEKARPTDPPGAAWRKDPIREYARSFMAFFLELTENALVPPSSDPMEKQSADHIRKYAGAFLNMDPAMLSLQLGYNPSGVKPAENPESCKSCSESPNGDQEPTVHCPQSIILIPHWRTPAPLFTPATLDSFWLPPTGFLRAFVLEGWSAKASPTPTSKRSSRPFTLQAW